MRVSPDSFVDSHGINLSMFVWFVCLLKSQYYPHYALIMMRDDGEWQNGEGLGVQVKVIKTHVCMQMPVSREFNELRTVRVSIM